MNETSKLVQISTVQFRVEAHCNPIFCERSERLIRKLVFAVLCGLMLFPFCSQTVFAQLPSGTWQYHWGDEFNGPALDSTKWSHNYPWGNTHNHLATMNPNNVLFGDGALTLRAQRNGSSNDFTSGAISSGLNRFTLNGGYVEARILLPSTPGSWPAFWGLYTGWPPEADIMEYPIDTAAGTGYQPDQYHTAFHYSTGNGNAAGGGQVNPGIGNLHGTYHNFGMHWVEDQSVAFYFNGQMVRQFNNPTAVAQMQHMYLILNYAVGGWPGTPNLTEWAANHSDDMKVDWVRVWKSAAASTTSWNYTGSESTVQWDTAGNWSSGSPNLGGAAASFGTRANAPIQNIDWTGRRTVTTMNIDGQTRYRFGWPDDRLVMAMGNNGSTAASINIASTSTQSHEIQGELEFVGGLTINNNSAQAFRLTGKLMGQGTLNINGPGAVVFEADDAIYGGNTVIGSASGNQGPAIARVRSQNPFGNGQVIIGVGGNATTARLELENNSLVRNVISLNGRNNSSIAIQNNSGSNIISGSIQAAVGGGQYRIASASGQLTLSGSASNGVALTSSATGNRTFTLQGNGQGVVSGTIINGLGTVGIIKEGNGAWSLNGQNTYTGTTQVSAGTLIVNGLHSGGADYTVGVNGRLAGNGIIQLAAGRSILVDGQLAPGEGIGTLGVGIGSVPSSVVFRNGSSLMIEVGANSNSDLLRIQGSLDLSSLSDSLRLYGLSGAFDGSDYVIARFTPGSLGSQIFDQVYLNDVLITPNAGNLGNGYLLRYDNVIGQISLTSIPEPSAFFILSMGLLITMKRNRRSEYR